ncbi:MAG: hypothetical protein M3065_07655 [Actinomycetota bacterium]|nr:hypothetical protein [Actinomycetota bacterium]
MNPLNPASDQDLQTAVDDAARKRSVEIVVNGKTFTVPVEDTGLQIKQTVGVPADFQLYRIIGHKEELIPDAEVLHVHEHERFLAAPTLDPALIANPAHEIALASVRDAFPELQVDAGDIDGGVTQVVLRGVEIGTGWTMPTIDLETRLAVTFPTSPPYPYYGPAGLAPVDGRVVPVQQVRLDDQPRAQISLNKPFDATVETLGARLAAVIAWMRAGR